LLDIPLNSPIRLKLPPRELGYRYTVVDRDVRRGTKTFHWPTLVFFDGTDDSTAAPVEYEDLYSYFEENARFGHQWRRTTAIGLGLFADFCASTMNLLTEERLCAGDEPLARTLLRGFAFALRDGTIPEVPGEPDPLGLRWRAKGDVQTGVYLASVTNYFTWLGDRDVTTRWKWLPDVPVGHPLNAMRIAAELAIRRKKSLLAHLDNQPKKPPPGRWQAGIIGPRKESTAPVYSFPEAYAARFLFEAFDLENDSQRTVATIAAVMFAAGLRSSEPLHAYVSDVQFVNGQPVFALHHPEFAKVSDEYGRLVTRHAYLAERGMLPRNRDYGSRAFAGWKGMANDIPGTHAFWLPIESLRERVAELLRHYIHVTRPTIMARRLPGSPVHPFLFVSAGLATGDKWGLPGDPFTMSALRAEWEAAIARLSRKYNDPSLKFQKKLGTTLHGPRHLFGRFLKTLGVAGEVIMVVMHHRWFESHLIYGRLNSLEVDAVLNSALDATDKNSAARKFEREIEKILS
jgi:integrase